MVTSSNASPLQFVRVAPSSHATRKSYVRGSVFRIETVKRICSPGM